MRKPLGVLGTRRKPFQDSPTPAGNSVAAIALLRLHAYTNDQGYYDKPNRRSKCWRAWRAGMDCSPPLMGLLACIFLNRTRKWW